MEYDKKKEQEEMEKLERFFGQLPYIVDKNHSWGDFIGYCGVGLMIGLLFWVIIL